MTLKYILAPALVLLLVCCATLPPPAVVHMGGAPTPEQKEDPFWVFPDTYRARALEYERRGELHQALFAWKIVRSFQPDDPEGLEKIEHLQDRIRSLADEHFQKGLDYLNKGSLQGARKEFLLTLSYNPEHREALVYLKTRTAEPDYTVYEVKKGDTAEGIAKKIYGDPGKEFLVVYFNDLDSGDRFKPGMVLKLAILEAEPKPEARPEAKQQAKPRAVVPPKVYDKARAEDHYRKGLNYFLAEDLQGAIREWEETLRLYPEHPSAKRDIEKARSLLVSMGSK